MVVICNVFQTPKENVLGLECREGEGKGVVFIFLIGQSFFTLKIIQVINEFYLSHKDNFKIALVIEEQDLRNSAMHIGKEIVGEGFPPLYSNLGLAIEELAA